MKRGERRKMGERMEAGAPLGVVHANEAVAPAEVVALVARRSPSRTRRRQGLSSSRRLWGGGFL